MYDNVYIYTRNALYWRVCFATAAVAMDTRSISRGACVHIFCRGNNNSSGTSYKKKNKRKTIIISFRTAVAFHVIKIRPGLIFGPTGYKIMYNCPSLVPFVPFIRLQRAVAERYLSNYSILVAIELNVTNRTVNNRRISFLTRLT